VRKVYGLDSDFIINGDKSLETVKLWASGLFDSERVKEYKFSSEALKWFLEVAFGAFKKTDTDKKRQMILAKIIHTREVVRAGFDIASVEKTNKWNEYQVGTVCLLHDVARFDQALLGDYLDSRNSFDHGDIGAEMVENSNFADFLSLGIDKKSLVESVRYHNKYEYVGDDKYAKMVRDADKLANLRVTPERFEDKIFGLADGRVSIGPIESYLNKKMVSVDEVKTRADFLLMILSWEFDFNFSETNKLFVDEGIRDWLVKELNSLGVEI